MGRESQNRKIQQPIYFSMTPIGTTYGEIKKKILSTYLSGNFEYTKLDFLSNLH